METTSEVGSPIVDRRVTPAEVPGQSSRDDEAVTSGTEILSFLEKLRIFSLRYEIWSGGTSGRWSGASLTRSARIQPPKLVRYQT